MFEEVRDHWYWRPGWRKGRSFYTWHITFADQPGATRLVTAYQPLIDALPGITPVPLKWLHLTMQGVGFADRVELRDLDAIIEAAESRCAAASPFTVTIGPAQVDPETVQLPVRPVEPLQDLRNRIRAAIADVWGPDSTPELPDLRPHISLGYWNQPAPAAPLINALTAHPEHTAELMISSISLINLNRDHLTYEWSEVAPILLG